MSIFIVNGAPGCGKTTFESMVKLESEKNSCIVGVYSTIDFVKEIAKKCGWDGTKSPENRKFLSDLKDLLTEWNDVPYKETLKWIEKFEFRLWQWDVNINRSIIFIDCREPNEIKRLCDTLKAKSILIRRADVENLEASNHADKNVLNYKYDIVIDNNGNLDDLRQKAV